MSSDAMEVRFTSISDSLSFIGRSLGNGESRRVKLVSPFKLDVASPTIRDAAEGSVVLTATADSSMTGCDVLSGADG